MKLSLRRWLLLSASTLIALAGCTGPTSDNVAADFRKRWIAAHSGPEAPFAGINSPRARNQFIDEFLVIKDLQFQNYVTALRRGSSYGELTADGSRLVLDGLAAVTGTAVVKSGLAAASAGITGFTGAAKKDVLFDQSLPVFIEKMVGLRATKKAEIVSRKSDSLADYSPSEAFADVEEYGELGSFDSALRAINIETAQSTGKAKSALAEARGNKPASSGDSGSDEPAMEPTMVKINERPVAAATQVDANKLRRDIKKLDDPGAQAMLNAAAVYGVLEPEIAARPQGTMKPREYLFFLIDQATLGPDAQAQLRAWRAIIPVNPVASPGA